MLWVITSYFNPAGYASRLRNYGIFRANLRYPLATVEMSLNGRFALLKRDAEIVLQITGGDMLWQKERLLNLVLRSLPQECDKVAWVDCDVIFQNKDWAMHTDQAIEEYCLVQPFRERCNLTREARVLAMPMGPFDSTSEAVARKIVMGTALPEDFRQSNAPLSRRTTAGLAWAARRDLITAHGLYDACILGSGDRAILCAAMGWFAYGVEAVGMRGRQIDHYLAWAEPFHKAVRGQVGFVEGLVFHLWHGDFTDRKYAERHEGLSRFDFDPYEDIALAPSGCWRWARGKSELHQYVKEYFESRKEDG